MAPRFPAVQWVQKSTGNGLVPQEQHEEASNFELVHRTCPKPLEVVTHLAKGKSASNGAAKTSPSVRQRR